MKQLIVIGFVEKDFDNLHESKFRSLKTESGKCLLSPLTYLLLSSLHPLPRPTPALPTLECLIKGVGSKLTGEIGYL